MTAKNIADTIEKKGLRKEKVAEILGVDKVYYSMMSSNNAVRSSALDKFKPKLLEILKGFEKFEKGVNK